MPLTVAVTRNVADRYRGLLSSMMPEVAVGVYAATDMSAGVRDRLLDTLKDWWTSVHDGSIVLMWRDKNCVGELALFHLGEPPRDLLDLDGVLVVRSRPGL